MAARLGVAISVRTRFLKPPMGRGRIIQQWSHGNGVARKRWLAAIFWRGSHESVPHLLAQFRPAALDEKAPLKRRHPSPRPARVAVSMPKAPPPQAIASERDLRLDLFRGIALWLIFLDHIPENILNWFTIRNYGFSDATEIFIFISGYTAAFVYGRSMRERGFVLASARILRRAWQIYVAHIFLFTIFMAEIAYVAATFDNPLYAEEMKILDFLKQPDITIFQALVVEVQAGQHGRAAALHRAAAAVSAGALSACCGGRTWRWPDRRWSMRWPGSSISTCPPIRTASGSSIRSPGNCCSCSAPGARSAARNGSPAYCARAIVLVAAIAYLVFAFAITLTWHFESLDRFVPVWLKDCDVSDRQDQPGRAAFCTFSGAGGGDGALRAARIGPALSRRGCSPPSAAASIRWRSSASASSSPSPASSSSPNPRAARCCRPRSAR